MGASHLRTLATLALVALLLVATAAPAVTDRAAAQTTQPTTDNSVVRIDLREDGSARWTVRIRTRLDTERRVTEYAAFQERFRNDTDRYLGPFRTRIGGVVAGAADATGREMRATDFAASTTIQEVPRRWGVVTYEFTWTNFARRADDRLVVGDVFEDGFLIAANDTLQVAAPPGYDLVSVDPAPDERSDAVATWVGRVDFADGRPRVVAAPAGGDGTSAAAPGPDLDRGVLLALLAAAALAVAAVVLYRRRGAVGAAVPGATTPDDPATAAPSPASSPPPTGDDGPAVATDEERVVALLEANDGRVRQAELAAELDWSASKTSRVVGRMAEAGTVEKLRLGRENLVTLADDGE